MALTVKCNAGAIATKSSRRAVVVRASAQSQPRVSETIQLAAAAFAAATLLATSSANAGVVLAKPELKKAFVPDPAAAVSAPSSSSKSVEKPKAAPKPKVEETGSSGGIDFRTFALPVSVAGIAGLGFAASKLDAGFDEFLMGGLIKDSNDYAGYEPALKTGNGVSFKPGTKKVKGKTTKKGFF